MSLPTLFRREPHKANKAHICCECGTLINKKDTYVHSHGLWEGVFETYKQCKFCALLADRIIEIYYPDVIDDEEVPTFGGLREWFLQQTCTGDHGREFTDRFAKLFEVNPDELYHFIYPGDPE